jgi:hypothetical protein
MQPDILKDPTAKAPWSLIHLAEHGRGYVHSLIRGRHRLLVHPTTNGSTSVPSADFPKIPEVRGMPG